MAVERLEAQLRAKRSALMVQELESVALPLFEARGFNDVTVEDICVEARISLRTFYRYFPTKEDVLQVRIDRRTELLRAALADRPSDEAPLDALRHALTYAAAREDPQVLRRWNEIVIDTPTVLRGVLGGIQLKPQQLMAEFLAERMGLPTEALVPTMLAAAAQGVVQAVHTRWLFDGGDLPTMLAEGLEVLDVERLAWTAH